MVGARDGFGQFGRSPHGSEELTPEIAGNPKLVGQMIRFFLVCWFYNSTTCCFIVWWDNTGVFGQLNYGASASHGKDLGRKLCGGHHVHSKTKVVFACASTATPSIRTS